MAVVANINLESSLLGSNNTFTGSNTFTQDIITTGVRAYTSAGLSLENSGGTTVLTLGAGVGTGATFAGGINGTTASFSGDVSLASGTILKNTSLPSNNYLALSFNTNDVGLVSAVNMYFCIDSDDNATGTSYIWTHNSFTTIMQLFDTGNLSLAGGLTFTSGAGITNVNSLSSTAGFTHDIDSDNTSGSEAWTLTKDGGATTVVSFNENGIHTFPTCAGFAIGASVTGNNPIIELGASSASANSGEVSAIDFHYGDGVARDFNGRIIQAAANTMQFVPHTFSGSVLDIDYETAYVNDIRLEAGKNIYSVTSSGNVITLDTARWASIGDITLDIDSDNSGTGAIFQIRTNASTQLLQIDEAGILSVGTHTAIGAETVTGYITIKDIGGTSRKIAVVS